MKLHGLMLVKNEGDFIERSVRHDLTQFDHIYIFDNGSSDATWEISQKLADEFPGRVIAWKTENSDFRDELRGEIFNEFKGGAAPGDWWCRLDADEIYVDDPREFLSHVSARHHVVWSIHFQYYFSEKDAARWEADPIEAARPLPDFADLPRSYLSNGGEARFFRHRKKLVWEGAWPRHMGVVHTDRIRLKHYQYRSPEQIQRRLDTRREAAQRGYQTFGHSLENFWKDKIISSCNYHQDDLSSDLTIDNCLIPNHKEPMSRRLFKSLMHTFGAWP